MKKIIAAAVATAFVAPAFAADVTVSGYAEFSYQDANGATSTATDNNVTFKAVEELDNGMTISADMSFNSNENKETDGAASSSNVYGNNDGGHSLTVAGPFGSIDMGDTNSAMDAIDDVTEVGKIFQQGTGSGDAAILWTLPTLVEGLTVNISHGAETNQDDNEESDGVSLKYAVAGATIGLGQQDNGDGTSHALVNATYSMSGVTVAYEVFTDTAIGGVDTDTTNMGVKYVSGPITLGYETSETKASNAAATSEEKVISVAYAVGGGFTVGLESYDDDLATNGEKTGVYAAFAF